MKYIQYFFASFLLTYLIYCTAILVLIDAPITSEYWVSEMITVKKELVKKYAGVNKIIIAGGSSTLFGFDAEYAGKQLNIPVINYGLHAGLSLGSILQEASSVVERGDILVLPLEPGYYSCSSAKFGEWKIRNTIGWNRAAWGAMSYMERGKFITSVPLDMFREMAYAAFLRKFNPAKISDRLSTLDKPLVLSKFSARTVPSAFAYSAYNLNSYGDMQQTEGSIYKGAGEKISEPSHVCPEVASQLISLTGSMKVKGVKVFFAHTPYIASGIDTDEIKKMELSFSKGFISVGCFIDNREDLVFDRKYFFNTNLHLNAEGRMVRTKLFVDAIRGQENSETCLTARSPNGSVQ
jgi:hypothetical protein